MKKILKILITFTVIISNFYMIYTMNNSRAINFLYGDRQIVRINFVNDSEAFRNQIVQPLKKFSEEHNISIMQFNYLNTGEMNIYAINIEYDEAFRLHTGELPHGDYFISNRHSHSEYQSGLIVFPISNWDIRIYDFNRVGDMGINGTFHLSGATSDTIDAFFEEFSKYGEISLENIDWNIAEILGIQTIEEFEANRNMGNFSRLLQIDSPLFLVVVLAFVLMFIGIFFFMHHYRKKIILEDLWGYSTYSALLTIPRMFLRFYIIMSTILLIGMSVFIFQFNQQYFFIDYLIIFLVVNLVIIMSFSLFTILVGWVLRELSDLSVNVRGKSFFKKMFGFSFVTKIFIYAGLVFVVITTVTNIRNLQRELENISYWNQAQNIFRVSISSPDSGGEVIDLGNGLSEVVPGSRRNFDDNVSAFYNYMVKRNNGFIMQSTWMFDRISQEEFLDDLESMGKTVSQDSLDELLDSVTKLYDGIPSYLPRMQEERDLYTWGGRNIIIDENYLRINPIQNLNGESVSENIQTNPYTLNILVPERGKSFENDIIDSFIEWFHFYKIVMYNNANEDLGLPLSNTTIDDLNINIIYTKNNQYYFTFNSRTGNSQNKVKDPVAIIYTQNLDTDFISSMLFSQAMFFFDDSRGNALDNITPLVEEANINGFPLITSVFSEANHELIHMQWAVFQQSILLVIISIFSLVLILVFIWAYYNANTYEINLKYLFGYSYWNRNKPIIFVTILANIIAGGFVLYRLGTTDIIWLIALLSAVDLLIIYILGNHLIKKNINKVLKGGNQ